MEASDDEFNLLALRKENPFNAFSETSMPNALSLGWHVSCFLGPHGGQRMGKKEITYQII